MICVLGAVLMVLFRGPALFGETEAEFSHGETKHLETSGHFMSGFLYGLGRWNLGVLCLIGNCTCMAAFLAIQACHFDSRLSKNFQFQISSLIWTDLAL